MRQVGLCSRANLRHQIYHFLSLVKGWNKCKLQGKGRNAIDRLSRSHHGVLSPMQAKLVALFYLVWVLIHLFSAASLLQIYVWLFDCGDSGSRSRPSFRRIRLQVTVNLKCNPTYMDKGFHLANRCLRSMSLDGAAKVFLFIEVNRLSKPWSLSATLMLIASPDVDFPRAAATHPGIKVGG